MSSARFSLLCLYLHHLDPICSLFLFLIKFLRISSIHYFLSIQCLMLFHILGNLFSPPAFFSASCFRTCADLNIGSTFVHSAEKCWETSALSTVISKVILGLIHFKSLQSIQFIFICIPHEPLINVTARKNQPASYRGKSGKSKKLLDNS